jgi:hypothetical protein
MNLQEVGCGGVDWIELAQDRERGQAENCTLLVYYTTSSGSFLLTFQDNLLVPSSGFKILKQSIIGKMGGEKSQ